jgi:hypothetical protein
MRLCLTTICGSRGRERWGRRRIWRGDEGGGGGGGLEKGGGGQIGGRARVSGWGCQIYRMGLGCGGPAAETGPPAQ